ncbi:MAG: Rrf2 family transcriptional regulator [Planctomycetes bacterium]|nr:Rrf2 family transcriptional regulator [Planctomycetota bacterium]
MKVSTRTRYGIRAAIELALHYNQGPLQLRIIAERQQISVKYLEQLVAVLRSGGIVRSLRGAKGGYLLAKAPDQVRMSDIFRCLEGTVVASNAIDPEAHAGRSGDHVAQQLWAQVETAVNKVLESVTLQDLLEQAGDGAENYQI